MKKSKLILLGMLVVLLVFGMVLTGCSRGHPLVGRWQHESGNWIYFFGNSGLIEFGADGAVVSQDEQGKGKWTADGNDRITVSETGGKNYKFTFTINKNILTLIDSDQDKSTYTRARR